MTAAQERARAALEQIAFADDPAIPVGARTQALGELGRMPAEGAAVEALSPEAALEEAESLASAMDGFLVCARVEAGLDPDVKPPEDPTEMREVIELQQALIDRLEASLAARERALQHERRHRLLPRAPESVA